MSDLVGNPEDRFSHNEARMEISNMDQEPVTGIRNQALKLKSVKRIRIKDSVTGIRNCGSFHRASYNIS